jgi:hypothetical protein
VLPATQPLVLVWNEHDIYNPNNNNNNNNSAAHKDTGHYQHTVSNRDCQTTHKNTHNSARMRM